MLGAEVVGDVDGVDVVGAREGVRLGLIVGLEICGDLVGCRDGKLVLGDFVGLDTVGCLLGNLLGLKEGKAVGKAVG